MTRNAIVLAVVVALAAAAGGCRGGAGSATAAPRALRLGFFTNLTHAVPIVGLAHGEYARALAPLTVEAKPFNAGPEAMEALFAGALDAAYVGPAPAISGYLRSHGQALVVVAAAAANGAGLVVRKASHIRGPNDLHGKKLASPQLGNTQDIALRTWLTAQGLKSADRGGDVRVMPLANADIMTLFKQQQLDGAWVPEPWLSRLIDEADGELLVDERDLWPGKQFPITVLVVTQKLAAEQPELVRKLVAANRDIVDWVHGHQDEARQLVDDGLAKWAKKRLPPKVLAEAWQRVTVTTDLTDAALAKQLQDGHALGYLPDGDISGLVDHRFAPAAAAPGGK